MKIRKVVVFAVLLTLCLGSVIFAFAVPTYDPHADVNDDGKIDIRDVSYVASLFGANGEPFVRKLFRYVVDFNATGYIAYNGTSGGLEYYAASDASNVVNYCIGQIKTESGDGTKGGIIHLRNGAYNCYNQIIMNKSDIILEGEGRATQLRPMGSLDCIIQVRNEPAPSPSTEAVTIRDLSFYGNSGTTIAIRFHNNDNTTQRRMMYPTIQNCNFHLIDGVSTDTSGFNDPIFIGLQEIRILDCEFSTPPHFAIKLWNVIDGSIRNIFADFTSPRPNTVGIEINYPYDRGSGIYLDDVSICYARVGINCTNGADVWFTDVVTDMIIGGAENSTGINLKDCSNIMITNAYSSAYGGTGFRLDNSYSCRFESCKAYNCSWGFWSALNIGSSSYNIFANSISEGNGVNWYYINQYDKFSCCNYIIQDAGYAMIPIGFTSVTVTHDIAGQPNVVTATAYSSPPVLVSVTDVSDVSPTFKIVRSDSTTALKVYWYAAMSDHLP